jgi:HAE1 family hydrophobic/amphiphilic exporter-1
MSPRDYDKEARLPRFSLDRRITVLVIFLTLTVVGVVATMGIPAELFPRGYTEPFLFVSVPWSDAPAREVLDKVTMPLEEEFGTVKGVDRVVSVSSTGVSMVYLLFKQNTDMDVAYREVRDRIERARTLFPDDIDKTFIQKHNTSDIPIFMVGIVIDPDVQNPYDLIQNGVILPVERVDGVATTNAFGLEEKEILIELDREKANAAGLNIYQLAMSLGDDNFTMASGPVRSGHRKLLLRSVANYRSIEELQNRLVTENVRLKDVATIRYDEPEKEYRARVNSRPAVALQVLKESEANTREVSRRLDATLEKIQEDPRLAALEITAFFKQGDIIDESLLTMRNSGLIGGFLAAGVLLFFMRRFRLTVIVALSIPFSLMVGITVMYFWGETLNIITLIGLMICVGLLVDNSVVVAENIHRLHREGVDRREACIRGAGEVALAITMSTLTTIIVFLPAALVDGPGRFFLIRLAVPVAVSVAGSLLVALVFIPVCVYLTLSSKAVTGGTGRLRKLHQRGNDLLRHVYEATFGRLNEAYNRLLARSLNRRADLVFGLIGVAVLTAFVTGREVEFVDQQEDEQGWFQISVDMPQNTTFEEAKEWFDEAEKVLETHKDEFGLDGYFVFHEKTDGELQGWFAPDRVSKITAKQATEMVMEELPERPGLELFSGSEQGGGTAADGPDTFEVAIHGEDPDLLERVRDDLEPLFAGVEGVLGLRKSGSDPPPELGLVVDREKAQQLDVNPQVIAGVVGYALRGQALPDYRDEGKEIPVRVRFQEEDRESLTELASFQVPANTGALLPLSSLTHTTVLPTTQTIVRRNKMISRTLTVELEEGEEVDARKRLVALMSQIDLPEGVSFGEDTQRQDLDNDLAGIFFALLLSIVFIYLLMGFLFESFILPLSILLTIPLSVIGVYWIHFLTGFDIDFLGAVGVIVLVGVVVNNGIVLIDYVNRLRSRGSERTEAVLTATHLRFRPIMMTAITTIGGMVPLAVAGATSIGLSYTSFALTLIGGMAVATLLTLLVVPIFYTMFDDARNALGSAIGKGARRRMMRDAELQPGALREARPDPVPGV